MSSQLIAFALYVQKTYHVEVQQNKSFLKSADLPIGEVSSSSFKKTYSPSRTRNSKKEGKMIIWRGGRILNSFPFIFVPFGSFIIIA
jgi:hypothetical protein